MQECDRNDGINFNSLPHAEVDLTIYSVQLDFWIFQLTTSRRGRLYLLGKKCKMGKDFNSLPHAEVDLR